MSQRKFQFVLLVSFLFWRRSILFDSEIFLLRYQELTVMYYMS